jgi:L-lysine 2,3-aminomutase
MDRWQAELTQAFVDPQSLLAFLELEDDGIVSAAASGAFPFRVTRSYAARMRKGDSRDPLLLQVLPAPEELFPMPGFADDPVGDRAAAVVPGILHK